MATKYICLIKKTLKTSFFVLKYNNIVNNLIYVLRTYVLRKDFKMPDWTKNFITVDTDKKTFEKISDLLTKHGINYQIAKVNTYFLNTVRVSKRQDFDNLEDFKQRAHLIFRHHIFDTTYGWSNEAVGLPAKMFDITQEQLNLIKKSLTKKDQNGICFEKPILVAQVNDFFEKYFNSELRLYKDFKIAMQNELDFNNLVPMPNKTIYSVINNQHQDDTDPYFWFNWCSKHWDTKWNAKTDFLDYHDDKHQGIIAFSTAWSEPTPVLKALSKKFPSVVFKNEAEYEDGDVITTHFKNGNAKVLQSVSKLEDC